MTIFTSKTREGKADTDFTKTQEKNTDIYKYKSLKRKKKKKKKKGVQLSKVKDIGLSLGGSKPSIFPLWGKKNNNQPNYKKNI